VNISAKQSKTSGTAVAADPEFSERGGEGAYPGERASLQQGSWGRAPSGVKGQRSCLGIRGRSPLKLKGFCPFSYKKGTNDGKS